MMTYLAESEIPFLIVLTKADKLKKTERLEREKRLAEELRDFENIVAIPFSAVNGEGVEQLRGILEDIAQEE